jgi:predicted AAA+ superfamily ATPase
MIERTLITELLEQVAHMPAVAVLGPRQVGKTTLVKILETHFSKKVIYLDLESNQDKNRLQDAELYLSERQDNLIVIDEVQRMPELFPLLRSLIDRHRVAGRFILLGSASPELLQKSSESLAGRITYLELQPLHWGEVSSTISYQQHWLRGGYPEMLLASSDKASNRRMNDFIGTYIERDLPLLGLPASSVVIRNLFSMLVSVHGNLLNTADLSRSLSLSSPTVHSYLDFLENAFIIRRLQPYYVNINKRLTKSPKLFIRDSGMFHALADITNNEALVGSLLVGSSWEGYVIQQIIAQLSYNISPYFYRTADGSELDLALIRGVNPVLGIEIKYSNSPKLSRGNYIASKDLGDIPLLVITPSATDYKMAENVDVCSLQTLNSYLMSRNLIG